MHMADVIDESAAERRPITRLVGQDNGPDGIVLCMLCSPNMDKPDTNSGLGA